MRGFDCTNQTVPYISAVGKVNILIIQANTSTSVVSKLNEYMLLISRQVFEWKE